MRLRIKSAQPVGRTIMTPDQRGSRPGEERENQNDAGKDEKRKQPRGRQPTRHWFKNHEGKGIDAPANNAIVLDLGGQSFVRILIAPEHRADFTPLPWITGGIL